MPSILETEGFDLNRRDSNTLRQDVSETPAGFGTVFESIPQSAISPGQITPYNFGQSDFDTGKGFWLGTKNGVPMMSIGDSAGNKMKWDGATLTLVGGVDISSKLDKLGGAYNSAASGARVQILPDSSTGIRAYDSSSNVVFLQNVGGADVGDVVMGREDLNQYAKWDQSASVFLVNGIDVTVGSIGGNGTGGILNLTSGTTNIPSGLNQYSSVTIASGAIMSSSSSSGVMKILCQNNFTLTGAIDLSDKLTSTTANASFGTRLGDTFTPTGKASAGFGGGGGGGGGVFGTGQPAGSGGAGNGGGAGTSGIGNSPGGGGASTGGGGSLGVGGAGKNQVNAGANGGAGAGGGGVTNSTNPSAGGGAGSSGGAGYNAGTTGGTGYGATGGTGFNGGGGEKGGAGGGSGGYGGLYGGMDLFINVRGNFIGASGSVDLTGSNGGTGGNGGNVPGDNYGGGGGGGRGADGGSLRLVYGGTYSASTYTLTGGSGGAGGNNGGGNAGNAGSSGSSGSSMIKVLDNLY